MRTDDGADSCGELRRLLLLRLKRNGPRPDLCLGDKCDQPELPPGPDPGMTARPHVGPHAGSPTCAGPRQFGPGQQPARPSGRPLPRAPAGAGRPARTGRRAAGRAAARSSHSGASSPSPTYNAEPTRDAHHVVAERVRLNGGDNDAVGAAGEFEALQFTDGRGAFAGLAVGAEVLQAQQLARRPR